MQLPTITRTLTNTIVRTAQVNSGGMEWQVAIDVSVDAMFPRKYLAELLTHLCSHFTRWSLDGVGRHEADVDADRIFDTLAGAIAQWVETQVAGCKRLVVHRPVSGERIEYTWH